MEGRRDGELKVKGTKTNENSLEGYYGDRLFFSTEIWFGRWCIIFICGKASPRKDHDTGGEGIKDICIM